MVYQFGNGTLSAFVDIYSRAYCYSRRAIECINEGDKCNPVARDLCLNLIPNRSSYNTPEEGLELVKAALTPFLQSGGTALDTYASRLMSKQYLMLEEKESRCSEPVDIALRIEHAMRKASEEDREKARAAVGKLLVDDPDYKEELHRRFF